MCYVKRKITKYVSLLRNCAAKSREVLLDTVFPEQTLCLCCKKVLRPKDFLTQSAYPEAPLCVDCRQLLEQNRLVKDDIRTRLLFTDACSIFNYEGAARELVLGLKHGTVAAGARPLIFHAAELARNEFRLAPDTVVTWVTMPANRRRERCIDHGKTLAEGIAKELGFECRQLLIRRNHGHTQQGLNAEQRRKNVTGLFTAVEGKIPETILLVDDVLTTGSTVEECSKVLRAAGAWDVKTLTVCKATKDKKV